MVIQQYSISLSNGEKVIASEPFDLKGPKTVLSRIQNATPETMFSVGDVMDGFCYFKAKDVVSIRTGDVKEINDGVWALLTDSPAPKRERRQGSQKA